MNTLLLILVAVIAYLCGGLNGAIITSRLLYHKDVRAYGSHNAGLTNFHRTFGVKGVAAVIAVDVLKSVVAVLLGGALMSIVGEKLIGQVFAGFCLIMGHIMPIMYQFKGGKGVLCAGTMILLVDWRVGLICWAAFIIVVIFTHYVSLASMIACLMAPIVMPMFGFTALQIVLVLFSALLVVFKHAENILRLIGGTENKLQLGKPGQKK